MKIKFTKPSIHQGRLNQEATQQVAENIPKLDGAPQRRPTRELSHQNQRMAGRVGARALVLMTNPEEFKRTDEFMRKFMSKAPAAASWREAKMKEMQNPLS